MRVSSLIIIVFIFFSCKDQKLPQEERKVNVPVFNSDLAYEHIEKKIGFGPRRMNSESHELCKDWLSKMLQDLGFVVEEQTFEATAYNQELLKGTNIHGVYNPKIKERVLLCAHYDTRHIADKDTINQDKPIDGADDGASGVAVILEIARLITDLQIPMGLDVVFFDAEDHGSDQARQDYTWGLGSQYWAKQIIETDYEYKYGILLDMVGAKNATFRKEEFSMRSAGKVVHQIWDLADQMGKDKYFVNHEIGKITDDHRFIIEKTDIPMVDIINVSQSGFFGHYHHKHSDNLDIIDKKTLSAVGQVITAQIIRESNKQNE